MIKKILFVLCGLFSGECCGIDRYAPGDTLWVWAQNGLNIRAQPDPKATVVAKAENGSRVIVLDFPNHNFTHSIIASKASVENQPDGSKKKLPGLELHGYWAKVQYQGKTGYVFDAYLSKLPTMLNNQYAVPQDIDGHVHYLSQHYKIIQQQGINAYDNKDHKSVRYIFDNGCVIQINGYSGGWHKEMLFAGNLSLLEGYLLYAHSMKNESDRLIDSGEDYLVFEIDTGTLTIRKMGAFLVFYESHAC